MEYDLYSIPLRSVMFHQSKYSLRYHIFKVFISIFSQLNLSKSTIPLYMFNIRLFFGRLWDSIVESIPREWIHFQFRNLPHMVMQVSPLGNNVVAIGEDVVLPESMNVASSFRIRSKRPLFQILKMIWQLRRIGYVMAPRLSCDAALRKEQSLK